MADVCLSGSRCSDVLDSEAIFNYESGSKVCYAAPYCIACLGIERRACCDWYTENEAVVLMD